MPSRSGFYQWVWMSDPMDHTPCYIMWSTHNHGNLHVPLIVIGHDLKKIDQSILHTKPHHVAIVDNLLSRPPGAPWPLMIKGVCNSIQINFPDAPLSLLRQKVVLVWLVSSILLRLIMIWKRSWQLKVFKIDRGWVMLSCCI